MSFLFTNMLGEWSSCQNNAHFLEVNSPLWFIWNFMRFIFHSCRIFSRMFVICFCNSNRRYSCCKFSTMLFRLEERNMVNWLQFIMSKKITWLLSIFHVEIVSRRKKWIIFAVSCIRFYPFNITSMQLEPPIVTTIIGLIEFFFYFVFFGFILLSIAFSR